MVGGHNHWSITLYHHHDEDHQRRNWVDQVFRLNPGLVGKCKKGECEMLRLETGGALTLYFLYLYCI